MSVLRAKFRPARAVLASVRAEAGAPTRAPRRARADRLARQLALAHRIERAVEAGEVASYGDVARALGVTQARVSQVMNLLMLSPALQEAVLLGDPGFRGRDLARAARAAEWREQAIA